MFDNEDDTSQMEAPCPCEHCGNWFDLDSGYGSEKWHPGIVICKKCHKEEEAEIENDEEVEALENELSDAQFTVAHSMKQLAKLQGHTIQPLSAVVFPSETPTISAIITDAKFKGAHNYSVLPMLRYDNGAVYGTENEAVVIPFVKKKDDGTWQPGVQTEQLLHVLIDRHAKLNDVFPADTHNEFMAHLNGALDCLQRRFTDRLDRGVAGKHEK